jgi:hypothetical protein
MRGRSIQPKSEMRGSSRAQADVDFGKGKGFNTHTPFTGYGMMVEAKADESRQMY